VVRCPELEVLPLLFVLMLAVYFGVIAGTVWALVRLRRSPEFFSYRKRVGLWLVLAAEAVYMLRSPACVYFPGVPGEPAIRRCILGSDSEGRVYWLEAEQDLAFAFGLRWWFEINAHALPGRGGLEWVPPLRFATGPRKHFEVVRSDGFRKSFDCRDPRLEEADPLDIVALRDGVFLLYLHNGPYRLDADLGRCTFVDRYTPGTGAGGEHDSPDGRPIRVEASERERGSKAEELAAGAARLETVAGAVILDPESGAEVGRREIQLPRPIEGGQFGRIEARAVSDGYLVFASRQERRSGVSTSDGHDAIVYHLDKNLSDPKPLGHFRWVGGSVESTWQVGLIATPLAVFSTNGVLIAEITPFLDGKAWSGRKLAGVRGAPFIGAAVLAQPTVPRHPFGSVQRRLSLIHRSPQEEPDSIPWESLARAAAAPRPWFFGGWDESGGGDSLVIASFESMRLKAR